MYHYGNIMYQRYLSYDLSLIASVLDAKTYRILLSSNILLTLLLDLVSFLPYAYLAAYSYAASQKSISADEGSSSQK